MNKCPKCGKDIGKYPALSRDDNKTEVCSDCGTLEAMKEFLQFKKGFTVETYDEYSVVLTSDGYVHHAIVGERIVYPIILDKDSGEFRNESGNVKLEKFNELIAERTAMWG